MDGASAVHSTGSADEIWSDEPGTDSFDAAFLADVVFEMQSVAQLQQILIE